MHQRPTTHLAATVAALALLLPPAGAHAAPLRLEVSPHLGWSWLSDAFKTPVNGGDTNTHAGVLDWGLSAEVYPYRGLLFGLDLSHGATSITTTAVSPTKTGVAWTNLMLTAGWAFPFTNLGPLHAIDAHLRYGYGRWASDQQTPVQITPSWTHHTLHFGTTAHLGFVDDTVLVRAGVDLVPVVGISENFATNGTSATGFGLDLRARADYDLGHTFGRWGDLLVGGRFTWASRWLSYKGTGSRRSVINNGAVYGVSEAFGGFSGVLLVSWAFPNGASVAVASAADEDNEARVEGHQIRITRHITFRLGSAELDLPRSRRALAAVAHLLRRDPQIHEVEVRGHTDETGNSKTNLQLSQKRAEAVVRALVNMGVSPKRLVPQGLGDTQPVASNATKRGRARNRRVEFRIVK